MRIHLSQLRSPALDISARPGPMADFRHALGKMEQRTLPPKDTAMPEAAEP
ncbi:hypothetical protein [Chelativorans intermedius]|uniref:Uncharacterized protein n=1 Tax=Chelativorans intermedius TaxID=515947 RepID=A0ABV6DBJ6_9HYPH|nr:hypothetical protein [Chelativorans intermedius]MCT8998041.1 hypothetical protein [Chelativorans intermedius]